MDATLNPDQTVEPSAEEIAWMQAEMKKMWIEIEACNARVEANRPEIDRLRAETHVILASIAEMMRR